MKLTKRENEVYMMVLQREKQLVIALELGIKPRTVGHHIENIKAKKNVKTIQELLLKVTDPTGERLQDEIRNLRAANDPEYTPPKKGMAA